MKRQILGLAIAFVPLLVIARCTKSAATVSGPATPAAACATPPTTAPTAGVFIRERFDDGCLSDRGWYDNTKSVISTSEHAPGSTSSLQFHFLSGATTPVNGAAMRHKFAPSNSLYVSYFVKHSGNWVGSGKEYHPHLFYALSTMDGDYDGLSNDWMTVYIEENYQNGGLPRLAVQDNKAINTLLGALPLSLLGVTESRSVGGCNGVAETNVVTECFNMPPWYNDVQLRGPVAFQPTPGPGYKGDWNFVEAYVQLNTVANGIGQADGVMQYWFNGSLLIDRHDMLLRTGARASLQLNQFVMAPYIGDGSPADQSMYIDDLTVASARAASAQARRK